MVLGRTIARHTLDDHVLDTPLLAALLALRAFPLLTQLWQYQWTYGLDDLGKHRIPGV